jgi:alkanesulfonate monooxygenase SsuD/methylene tetrahydromethanopterin reductase-like flavin-dependent oxidoreductase (luciferase family)
VIERMGPFAIVFLHALWEQSTVASGLPESLAGVWSRYRDEYVARSKTPADRRYLDVHEGHLIYLKPGEEKYVDENLVKAMTLTGRPEEIIERIKALEAAGLKQVSIQVVYPHGREMIEEFGRNVIAKY